MIYVKNCIKKIIKYGIYRQFKIYEPKERIILSLPFRDRVFHQWYVEEFIKPIYMKRFIKDTYACIPDRGLHGAVTRLQYFMNRKYRVNPNFYIMKFDISKFFYSIDKNILYEIVSRRIKDKKFLNCTKRLIFDGTAKGIPIGNYTSQFFANIYLNELDHYMKDEIGIKEYIRYMDDFIVLTNSKEEAIELKKKVSIFLKEKLDLKLNKKTNYFKAKQGVAFVRIPYICK